MTVTHPPVRAARDRAWVPFALVGLVVVPAIAGSLRAMP